MKKNKIFQKKEFLIYIIVGIALIILLTIIGYKLCTNNKKGEINLQISDLKIYENDNEISSNSYLSLLNNKITITNANENNKVTFKVSILSTYKDEKDYQISLIIANNLSEAININIDGKDYIGMNAYSSWHKTTGTNEYDVTVNFTKTYSGDITINVNKTNDDKDLEKEELGIYTKDDFILFMKSIKNNNINIIKVKLHNDITFEENLEYYGGKFNGYFDGLNHTIKGIIIKSSDDNVGIFGILGKNSTVKNINIENISISGKDNVGVIAGKSEADEIANITVKGNVLVSGNNNVGGICGENETIKISKCMITGKDDEERIIKGNEYIGGICGKMGVGANKVSDCEINVNIEGNSKCGGIAGVVASGNIIKDNTLNDTTINTLKADDKCYIGAIAGAINYTSDEIQITDNSFTGFIYGNYFLQNDAAFGEYESESQGIITNTNNKIDYEANIKVNDDTYNVYTMKGLFLLSEKINEGDFKNKTVNIMRDIDLSSRTWLQIDGWNGAITGTVINGNNKTISNMYISDVENGGFISRNSSSFEIKNLTFDKAYIKTKENKSQTYASVLIGKNYANVTIDNIKVTNSTIINNWQCGGLIGYAEGAKQVFKNSEISDCFFGGDNATAGIIFGLGIVDVNVENCKANNIKLYTDGLTWNSTQKEKNFWVGHLYGKELEDVNSTIENVEVVTSYPQ